MFPDSSFCSSLYCSKGRWRTKDKKFTFNWPSSKCREITSYRCRYWAQRKNNVSPPGTHVICWFSVPPPPSNALLESAGEVLGFLTSWEVVKEEDGVSMAAADRCVHSAGKQQGKTIFSSHWNSSWVLAFATFCTFMIIHGGFLGLSKVLLNIAHNGTKAVEVTGDDLPVLPPFLYFQKVPLLTTTPSALAMLWKTSSYSFKCLCWVTLTHNDTSFHPLLFFVINGGHGWNRKKQKRRQQRSVFID